MKQFTVNRIWATSDPVELFADVGTEVYKYIGPLVVPDMIDTAAWNNDGRLYRDFWNFFCDRKDTNGVYHNKVLARQSMIIKEIKK